MSDGTTTPMPNENVTGNESFEAKLARAKAKHAAKAPTAIPMQPAPQAQPAVPSKYDADIPEVETGSYTRTPYDEAVDAACESITFKEVYAKLPGAKYESGHENREGEGILLSCPDPAHPDLHPSAWLNTKKGSGGTAYCGGCAVGFDKYKVAAYVYGYPVPGFQEHPNWGEIKRRMAADFRGVQAPEPEPLAPLEVPAEPEQPEEEPEQPELPDQSDRPTFDWRSVLNMSPVHQNGGRTFLMAYCEEASKNPSPEEFNLFNGLLALGLAAGNRVLAQDMKPLSANFGVCFVAHSGAGKSRSTELMTDMLRRVTPGVDVNGTVFSGQAMVEALDRWDQDPSNKNKPAVRLPVTALFEYPEMSEIAGADRIHGSITKTKIHEILDHKSRIEYRSKTGGKMAAHDAFASIVTTTQPKRLRDLLDKSDAASGFLNRFLFIMGRDRMPLARGSVLLNFAEADLQLDLILTWAEQKDRYLPWDDDADALWEKIFFNTIYPKQRADSHDILTRLDLNLKRMILGFAINEHAESIQLHHVAMAVSLIPYLVKCYEQVIGALLNTESREITDWLLQKIRDIEVKNIQKAKKAKQAIPSCPGPSARELNPFYKSKGWDVAQMNRALKELVEAGLVVPVEAQKSRGPATTRYQVADRVGNP